MEPDEAVIESVRRTIGTGGTGSLTVDDLRPEDLSRIAWSGSPSHLRSVGAALERASQGFGEYLAVRAPGGEPIAKVRIDYSEAPGIGTLSQLVTEIRLRGLGVGTLLVRTAEGRAQARGVKFTALCVEDHNPRARALYERLGYEPYTRKRVSWDQEADDGTVRPYETEVVVLRKRLPS